MLDGAPVVGQDKADRLLKAITKTASKEAGIAIQTHQIEMPVDEQGQSKGFMFVSLHNPTEAQVFQRALDGYAFDKRHTLSVVPFTEVESYANLDDTYVEPEQEEWAPRVSPRAKQASLARCEADGTPRRSTSVHGSQTPPAVTSSSSTSATTSVFPGPESLASARSHTSAT